MDEQKENKVVKSCFKTEDEQNRKEEFNKRWLSIIAQLERREEE